MGNTPVNKRIEMVDEFNDNEDIKVFLISPKAGGTGLNLTSVDVVIHYDPWMQERKEKLSKDVLSTEETFISKMTKEEILDLFE